MATIKSFTSVPQSLKLKEFLPLESADMKILPFTEREYRIVPINDIAVCGREDEIYAWSLAALLEQFEDEAGLARDYGLWFCYDNRKSYCTEHYDNPIDACVELILKLNELNLL